MNENIKDAVRKRYAGIASQPTPCCSGADPCSCSSNQSSIDFGYTAQELATLPSGADLTLGCGNPTALARIEPGDTVLDLGSGGGIDCFLAAQRVGPDGRVIGVDMTPDMISRARRTADRAGFSNVEFRLGEIEHIPAADNSVDLVISNCVINLSTDKSSVFGEVLRVLKPGGKLIFSDPVLTEELPDRATENVALFTGCISGAMQLTELIAVIEDAGFNGVQVREQHPYAKEEHLRPLAVEAGVPDEDVAAIAGSMISATIEASKGTAR